MGRLLAPYAVGFRSPAAKIPLMVPELGFAPVAAIGRRRGYPARPIWAPLGLLAGGILLGLLAGPAISADKFPKDPILQFETGMHTGAIRRIDVDAANRFLVSGSNDKTVRVWDVNTGRLLRTLRVPQAPGVGEIYAVAISPDGSTIAAGGWTGFSSRSHSIYVFDRPSGNITRRLSGLENVVHHLAFSKNGRYLAVALGGEAGIRVFETAKFEMVAKDGAYKAASYRVDFDASGRLVSASLDGGIRLYDSKFERIGKTRSPTCSPYSAVFSPDGSRIAVGHFTDLVDEDDDTEKSLEEEEEREEDEREEDEKEFGVEVHGRVAACDKRRAVHVFSSETLELLFSADTPAGSWRREYESLSTVAWSSDGDFLYAGGRPGKDSWSVRQPSAINRWDQGGRGVLERVAAVENTLLDIRPLSDGRLAVGTAGPVLAVVDRDMTLPPDTPTWISRGRIAEFRHQTGKLRLADDGATVSFLLGDRRARFSLPESLLRLDGRSDKSLSQPASSSGRLEVSGESQYPWVEFNGKSLMRKLANKLSRGETVRSLAVVPGQERLLLGADWSLRLLKPSARQIWKAKISSPAWSVGVTPDGRWAVAALGDGTIRWYRVTDGVEQLALFPRLDGERWVIWTPSGYYEASVGAEGLIGWQVNRGSAEAPDFFPASRFRSTYYRPDIVAEVLATMDEADAVRVADAASGRASRQGSVREILPPVVEIVSPAGPVTTSEAEVTVEFRVRSAAPVTGFRAFVEGRPATRGVGAEPPGVTSETRALVVPIPAKDCVITVVAESRHGAGAPATLHVRWEGREPESPARPTLYVLAVGVSEYESEALKLAFAAKDATDFTTALEGQEGGLYRSVLVRSVTDLDATKGEVLDGLEWLEQKVTSDDVAMVLIAGHGVNDLLGQYYFLPTDVDGEHLKRTAIASYELRNTMSILPGRVLFFIDTCHSGNVLGARRGVADITGVVNELVSAENGVVVFAASTGRQYSLEDPSWGNGAFTKALVEGLNGEADYHPDGEITLDELQLYLSVRVKTLTEGRQTPATARPRTVPDYPIAVSSKGST